MDEGLVIIRGAGDIATGVIQKFHRAGCRVLALEVARPLCIRRTVALCEAIPLGAYTVEDLYARRVSDEQEIAACWDAGEVPVAVDPDGRWIERLAPDGVVDAILAKRNTGTHIAMAGVVIGLGPGFVAGTDVHAVIETMRGHGLGRVILRGGALPNTGIPGEIGGRGKERVIHAPVGGIVRHVRRIGDVVKAGETLLLVGDTPCMSPFDGLLRGLIAEGIAVPAGTKIADVDPRIGTDIYAISDKARAVGGGALEAYLWLRTRRSR